MKVLDFSQLGEVFLQWQQATSRFEKGAIIQKACTLFGLSEPALRNRLNQLKSGEQKLLAIAGQENRKSKRRLSEVEETQRHEDIIRIMACKYDVAGSTPISTEHAIMKAENIGWIESGKYKNRFLVEREARRLGLDKDSMNRRVACVTWKVERPFQVVMVDATPAQCVYLNAKGKASYRPDLRPEDRHFYEDLEKYKLKRIIIYCLADVFSGSFFCYADAPDPKGVTSTFGGENAQGYLTLFRYAFLEKDPALIPIPGISHLMSNDHIPVRGLPETVYGDNHSALKTLKPTLERLGSGYEKHFPGNPRAKGYVEARNGWLKRIQAFTNQRLIQDVEQFNEFLYRWMVSHNHKQGYYKKFIEGTKSYPVQAVTAKNLEDALVSHFEREVSEYGTVSIKKQDYFVGSFDTVGRRITIFPQRDGYYAEVSGKMIKLDPEGKIQREEGSYENMDNRHAFSETEKEKYRKAVRKKSQEAKNLTTFQDIVPSLPETKVGMKPRMKPAMKTHTPLAPEVIRSIIEAEEYLEEQIGSKLDQLKSEVREAIKTVLESELEEFGCIHGKTLMDLSNTLKPGSRLK
ncbi:hypothetical protein FH593_04495 [Leptospira interrogans]|uniref:Integrase catalytic domain-containing protein n=1 Tax=Leptospira interrogans serovar Pyrogenes str. 200701872 TaxID=1193029 RepID=M6ZXY0_LEPIR|nr:hypothetical protein [Leptospira interrogans]EMP06620.1 hypothetical protein LEP1GSC124_1950 [Leptospira interrogans serovar Pyrogenes str. 200701872]KAA1266815.1 hypothetical protein C5473_01105 [Leptospira interrogans serovar Weerasinghe]EMN60846.1 hypothetical protein LEP1GSC092_4181 [Leptospira interrogans serovar Pyrogenes str. R168]ULG83836.1 hypothetical protein FH594_16235 [Leptospira interrogans]ULG89296.1 hypothetical protein FH593_04495 [Leptospira interrogans]